MARYSSQSLRDKLGLKSGFSAVFLNAPLSYIESLGDIDDIEIFPVAKKDHDFIHFFVKEKSLFESEFVKLRTALKPTGMLWVSWPKGSQKVLKTDLTENIIRDFGLKNGLVDVKVAAIDDVWSGLKFVCRLVDR